MGMSGMADEMARRIAEDEGAGLPDGAPADLAPGTGGESATAPPPPAGESNTDTGGNVPESIPYARFKEVNDQLSSLRGYETLREYGYDPDSLGRLAAFEAQYLHDPVGTWAALADNLDLPQEVTEAVKALVAGNGAPSAGRAEGESSGEQQPATELPAEVREALQYVGTLRQREQADREEKLLDSAISHWDKLDKEDGIETPEATKLAHISAVGNSGLVFRTTEEIVEAARKTAMEYRESVLGSAVRTGRGGTPLAVSGTRAAVTDPVDFGGDIRKATEAARAALERGELPPMRGD